MEEVVTYVTTFFICIKTIDKIIEDVKAKNWIHPVKDLVLQILRKKVKNFLKHSAKYNITYYS